MNICFVISSLEVGGAQTFVIRLANHLAQKTDLQISLFDLDIAPPNCSRIQNLLSDKVIYKRNSIKSRRSHIRKIKDYLISNNLRSFLRKNSVDIISSHLFHADSLVAKSQVSIPFSITDHGDYKNKFLCELERRRNLRAASLIVANSNFTQLYLREIFNVNTLTIDYGYEIKGKSKKKLLKSDLGISDNSFVYVMTARGIAEKGWIQAIQAFSMHSYFNDSYLLLIGDGVGIDEAKEFAKEHGIENISFLGFQDNPEDFLSIANASILPSHFESESVGLSLVESIFQDVPVIATDWGGLPAVVLNPKGDCGLLCPIKNGKADVVSLAKCMDIMHDKHDFYKKNTQHCKGKYSMEYCSEKYLKTFSEILAYPSKMSEWSNGRD